jgi:two-component system LytT family response regulator
MSEIRVIHIDDEQDSLDVTRAILNEFTNIEYLGGYTNPIHGFNALQQLRPDLLLLDVEMPSFSGFKLAEMLQGQNFKIVFITGHTEFAIKAFDYNALHYILKPLTFKKMEEVLNRISKEGPQAASDIMMRLEDILRSNQQPGSPTLLKRLPVNTLDKIDLVPLDQVVRINSSGAYSIIVLTSGNTLTSSKSMAKYEEILTGHPDFIRVHRSHIVNKNYVARVLKDTGQLLMENGDLIDISALKKGEVLEALLK